MSLFLSRWVGADVVPAGVFVSIPSIRLYRICQPLLHSSFISYWGCLSLELQSVWDSDSSGMSSLCLCLFEGLLPTLYPLPSSTVCLANCGELPLDISQDDFFFSNELKWLFTFSRSFCLCFSSERWKQMLVILASLVWDSQEILSHTYLCVFSSIQRAFIFN